VPPVLDWCCGQIEAGEGRDGIYRLSGQASHIQVAPAPSTATSNSLTTLQALRQQFDSGRVPESLPKDLHAVASLLKLYFR
jgi:hypothetical protein